MPDTVHTGYSKMIYKYSVNLVPDSADAVVLYMPPSSRIVHVASQTSMSIEMWVEFPTTADGDVPEERVRRVFCVCGTGFFIGPEYEHVGTVPMTDGYVWHLYEKMPIGSV